MNELIHKVSIICVLKETSSKILYILRINVISRIYYNYLMIIFMIILYIRNN